MILNTDSVKASADNLPNGELSGCEWLRGVNRIPSPNFNSRPADAEISLLVIHNISLPPGEYGNAHISDFFTNQLDCHAHPYFTEIADLQVSSHFLIDRCGQVTQFVSLENRAWHAGQSCFQGRENCNDFSVGIELEGTDDEPYTSEQYGALAKLARQLMILCPAIREERIVGHSDIAPGRKTDPGPSFDWPRFRGALVDNHRNDRTVK